MKRRNFIKNTGAASAGIILLPTGTISGRSSLNKLNIALIGAHGRGKTFYRYLKNDNVVALCDINDEKMAIAAAEFPKAEKYRDWRKCLERNDLDAVIVAAPDHHHAFISIWAMNRGLHVYCEKPLGECVHEAREVRRVYLKNRQKLATQHGTQRHSKVNFERVSELVRRGAIGDLTAVQVWGSRHHNKTGYLPAAGPVPKSVDWEQWIGPVQFHPYNPEYLAKNCLNWNMYHDFGSWQVGDMGSHTMDLAWNAIDADLPVKIRASGEPWDPEVCPSDHHSTFIMPANDWRGEITLEWYQGNLKPESPHTAIDLQKIGHGAMFKGTKGTLVSSFDDRILIPSGGDADMTYYDAPNPGETANPMGDFYQEWRNACTGNLKTSCDFDYAGGMIETLMLGLVAHKAGKELMYDPENGRITNDESANKYLQKEYRKGWMLDG